MKTKRSAFSFTALSGAAVVFACLTGINANAQAEEFLWTGNSGVDQQYSTGANWVGGTAPGFDWAPVPTFGSAVVNGTVDMGLGYIAGSVVVASGATTDITFNGPGKLILGKLGGADDATVHLAAGGKNLTFNSPIGNAGWDGLLGFDVGAGRTLTLNGGIIGNDWGGGPATVVKTGTGAAVITSGSINIGGMTISEGTLQIGDGTDGHDGSLTSITTVNNNAAFVYNLYGNQTAAYPISGSGTLTKLGTGTLTLTGAKTYSGATTVTGGTLQIGDGASGNDGSLSTSGITDNAALVYNLYGNQTAAYPISGSGSFTKNGVGTLTLTGSLTCTGTTTVNGGTLQTPDGNWKLENLNIVVNSGATLNMSDGNSRALSWTLNGGTVTSRGDVSPTYWGNLMLYDNQTINVGGAAVSTIGADLMLGTNSIFAVGAGSTLNVTNPVRNSVWAGGGNGSLVKTEAGTLALSGANYYTGATTIDAGTFAIAGAGTLGNGSYGNSIINNGAFVYGSSAAQTLSGAISGTGTLTQNAGTLTLSGNNTYSGATTVNAGKLDINNAAAIGGTSGITVSSGGQVYFGGGMNRVTVTQPIQLSGEGGSYQGALRTFVESGEITFTGPVTLLGSSIILGFGGYTKLNFSNAIRGTGDLVFAAQGGAPNHKDFMVLSGASDFAGDLLIVPWDCSAQVTLNGGDNRLPTTAVVRVSGSTAMPCALDLNGNNQTIAGLSDGGWGGDGTPTARNVVNTSGTAVTLTLNTIADQSFSGTIGGKNIDGTVGNNLALVKTGTATQTLTGLNTYTGSTAVSNGTLVVKQKCLSETADVHIASGAMLVLDFPSDTPNTVRTLTIDGVLQVREKVYSIANRPLALAGTGRLYVTDGANPPGTLISFF